MFKSGYTEFTGLYSPNGTHSFLEIERPDTSCQALTTYPEDNDSSDSLHDRNFELYGSLGRKRVEATVRCVAFGKIFQSRVLRDRRTIYSARFYTSDFCPPSYVRPQTGVFQKRTRTFRSAVPRVHRVIERDFDFEINAHLLECSKLPVRSTTAKRIKNSHLSARVRMLCALGRNDIRGAEKALKYMFATHKLDNQGFSQAFSGMFSNSRKTLAGAVQSAQRLRDFQNAISYKASDPTDMTGNIVSRLEDLVAFFTSVINTKNFYGFLSSLHLYVRTFYTGSVTTVIMDMIAKIFDSGCDSFKKLMEEAQNFGNSKLNEMRGIDLTNQSDEVDMKFDVESIKNCLKNWRGFHKTNFAQKLANIVNVLVTFGICPDWQENPLKIGAFELFKARVWDTQENANDFVDMIIDTAVFFIERGVAAFEAGDLSLLMYDDKEAAYLELEYATLISATAAIVGGRLSELSTKNGFKDINEFEVRLDTLLKKMGHAIKKEKNPHAKSVFVNRYVALSKLETELILLQKKSPIKDAPLAIMIHSGSNMAKTTVNNVVGKTILEANDFQSSKEFVVFINDADKYDTEVQAWHTWIVLDDFCNTAPDHYDASPLNRIINLKNNIPKAATKADVDSKGNVYPRPKLLTIPTNVRHMHAHIFSSEPASVLRRMDYVMDLFLRPGYVNTSTGGIDTSLLENQFCPNAWRIRITHYRIIRNEGRLDTVEEVIDQNDIDLNTARLWLAEQSKEFYRRQDVYTKSMEEMFDCKYCEHLYPPGHCPTCEPEKFTEKDEDGHAEPLEPLPPLVMPPHPKAKPEPKPHQKSNSRVKKWKDFRKNRAHMLPENHESKFLGLPQEEYMRLCVEAAEMNVTLSQYMEAKKTQDAVDERAQQFADASEDDMENQGWSEFVSAKQDYAHEIFNPLAGFSESTIEHSRRVKQKSFFEQMTDRYVESKIEDIVNNCATFGSDIFDQIKKTASFGSLQEAFEKHKGEILVGVLGASLMVGIFAAIKHFRAAAKAAELIPQGAVLSQPDSSAIPIGETPTAYQDEKQNPWKLVKPTIIPKSDASKTATMEQVVGMLKDHTAHIWIEKPDLGERTRCNMFPLEGNCWLIPHHVLSKGRNVIKAEIARPEYVGPRFEQEICEEDIVEIPGDFAVVRLIKGGSQPQLKKFLSAGDWDLTSTLHCKGVLKRHDGTIESETFKIASKQRYENPGLHRPFDGFEYKYPKNTEKGMCMMPIVTCQRKPAIIGFHMAGESNGPRGVASVVSIADVDRGLEELNSRRQLTCHSASEFITNKYGIDYTPTLTVPTHHSVNYLTEDETGQSPSALVLGQHPKGSVKFKSGVRKSVISDAVSEKMQIPRQHGAPSHYKIWRHWHRDLNAMTHPKGNFDPIALNKAHDDLANYWRNYCAAHPAETKLVKPYSKETTINGADGVNSVDRIDASTSMGWPLNKAKKHFMKMSDEEVPGISINMDFEDPEVWNWVEFFEAELLAGRRINAIFRANLKDEATKFTKDKIRVFAGCEVAFTLLVRKYYLPIVRFIQNSSNELECAVGINATSPEWTKLAERLLKYDSDRFFAGDYKQFDKNASIESILRAFNVLFVVAVEAGYEKAWLKIMMGIASEISQPLYEYDGIFLLIFGSNPSGHPLTVIINNIINALYMRYAYYKFHEKELEVPPFADRIVLNCYGDDNFGAFHPEETMGMHDIGRILGEAGITYTTADKRVITEDSIPFEELSFLKRGFLWSEELGKYLAPIELASISKSLHNYIHRKGSDVLPEVIAADAIKAANREFFHHGKTIYAERRKQLLEVCKECPDVAQFVGELDTYEDLADAFLNRQSRKNVLDEPMIVEFSFGSVQFDSQKATEGSK